MGLPYAAPWTPSKTTTPTGSANSNDDSDAPVHRSALRASAWGDVHPQPSEMRSAGNAAIRSAECYRGGGGHTNGGRGSSGSDFLTNDCGECYKINPFCQVFIEINHFHRLEKTVTYWTERETSNACFNASSINQDRSNPFNIWGPL